MHIYFDIETDGLNADECAFKCAVAHVEDGPSTTVHTFTEAQTLVKFLLSPDHANATMVTFNGLGFDFPVLMAQCDPDDATALRVVARDRHVDIMFAFLVEFGYRASMNSFATCMGLEKSWDGAAAAESKDMAAILEYCGHDVTILQAVYSGGATAKRLVRKSNAGRLQTWVLPLAGMGDINANIASYRQNPPDTSWMTGPVDIGATFAWLTPPP